MKTTFLCMVLMLTAGWIAAANPEKEIRGDNVPNLTFDQMMGVVMQLRVGMTPESVEDVLGAPEIRTSWNTVSDRPPFKFSLDYRCSGGWVRVVFVQRGREWNTAAYDSVQYVEGTELLHDVPSK